MRSCTRKTGSFVGAGSTRTSKLKYAESAQVHLQVRDCGVGTPGKELGKVFKAFHRADATRSGLHEFATKLVLDKSITSPDPSGREVAAAGSYVSSSPCLRSGRHADSTTANRPLPRWPTRPRSDGTRGLFARHPYRVRRALLRFLSLGQQYLRFGWAHPMLMAGHFLALGVCDGGAIYKDPPLAESLPFAQHPLPALADPPMCQRQSSPAAKPGSTSASVQLLVRRLSRVPRADNVVPALRR
jgi:hypothetical protein